MFTPSDIHSLFQVDDFSLVRLCVYSRSSLSISKGLNTHQVLSLNPEPATQQEEDDFGHEDGSFITILKPCLLAADVSFNKAARPCEHRPHRLSK